MSSPKISRRGLLQGTGGLIAASIGVTTPAHAAAPLTVGFIYDGSKRDFGYNQSHAEAAAAVGKIEGVKIVEEENVPETNVVQKTLESMIQLDQAKLIFPTSYGYFDPFMLSVAQQNPGVQFRHCGGLWKKEVHPRNTGSYFGYIGTGVYLNGIAAGHATKTKKIGFVAAKAIPQVLLNINSFALGARSVDPSITTQVIFTGDWKMPIKEAEAVNSLVDNGVDVITFIVEGGKTVIESAERRGVFSCGFHVNQQSLAPKGYLTGAEWDWTPVYTSFVKDALAGRPLQNFVRGGLKEGFVKMSPYGSGASQAARNNVDDVKAKMLNGGFSVFSGPLKDNKGKIVVPSGASHSETDIELESMNYLVEGVVGSIG